MSRLFYWLATAVFGAGAAHLLIVLLIPAVAEQDLTSRIEAIATPGEALRLDVESTEALIREVDRQRGMPSASLTSRPDRGASHRAGGRRAGLDQHSWPGRQGTRRLYRRVSIDAGSIFG